MIARFSSEAGVSMQISGSVLKASAAAAFAACVAGSALAQTDRSVPLSQAQVQLSFAPVASRASPAVVNVYADRTLPNNLYGNPFFRQFGVPRERMERSLGGRYSIRSIVEGLVQVAS